MNNNMNPDSNHFDDFMDEEEKLENEKEVEEIEEDYTEEEYLDDNNQDDESSNNDISKEIYKAKMLKLFVLVIVIFLVILLFAYLFSLFSRKKYSYTDVEGIMRNAAISYFQDNKKSLPATTSKNVEISDSVLSEEGYMKPLEKYTKNDSCSGKVVVKKESGNEYQYTAYLNCGDDYQTREFYKELLSNKNIVTSGYGLYKMNNEYVYRGQNLNNFVRFNDSSILWRIVKITSNNEIVLVLNNYTENSYIWDERYNSATTDNTGINVFDKSNMSIVLNKLYRGYFGDPDDKDYYEKFGDYDGENVLLSKEDKEKVKTHTACVGNRSTTDTSRDGSSECKTTAKLKLSLLPVYDYMNASIDPGCKTTLSPECQNYNYLVGNHNYWLATGNSEASSKVYMVKSGGYVDDSDAANSTRLKTVIHIDTNAMIIKGKGTSTKPYVIR